MNSNPIGMMATEGVGRNQPCPCGSGKKHKKCCGLRKPGTATLGDLLTPEATRTLNSFLTNKLKSIEPKETRVCTRVDSTLDLRDALKPEIDHLIEHLQKVEKWFNYYLRLKGLSLSVSTESIQHTLQNGGQSEKYAFVQTWRKYGTQPGFIYESNVKNFVDILDHVLSDGRSINAIGGAQAGKTNFEVIWMLLGPAVLVLTNAAVLAGEAEKPLLYFPIISGPPHKNLGRQSQHAINNLFKMYGRMKFQTPNSSLLSSTSALNYFKQFLEIEPTYYEENTLDRSRGEAEIDLPNKFVRRATQKSMDDLRTFIQDRVIYGLNAEGNARKERDLFRFEFLLIIDEAHHGAMDDEEKGNVSLFSKLMKSHLIYDDEEQTFANIVSDPDTLSRVILASATNWLAENEKLTEKFEEVRLPLGDDYHGPNVFNCEYIDSSKQTTKPYYGGLSELADKAQQPFFKYFSPRAYEDVEVFRQVRDGMSCRCPRLSDGTLASPHVRECWVSMNHAEYRELSNKTLANIIRWMAISSGDISGDMVIRFCNDNSLTKSIASNVQPYLSDVDLKAWTGDRAGTAKEFILEHKKTSQKPVAVLVTGRARMGDDFPRSVRHYVEFATKITTLSALDQGLCGRACGYNKFWKEVPSNYKAEPGRPTRIKEGKMEIGVGNCVWLNDDEAVNADSHVASLANPLVTGRKPHQAVKVEGLRAARNDLFGQFAGIGYALNDTKIDTWLDQTNAVVTAMLRHDVQASQGKMVFRPENFAANDVIPIGPKHYIPIFRDFDPAAYINSSPELSRKVKRVSALRIFGPKDAQNGTMGAAPYDVSDDGYVRASFEWGQTIDSFTVQDNHPGKQGMKDHTASLPLVIGKRLGEIAFQKNGTGSPTDRFCSKVAEFLDAGLSHSEGLGPKQLAAYRNNGKGKRCLPIQKWAQECGLLDNKTPALRFDHYYHDSDGNIAVTFQDVRLAQGRRYRSEEGLARAFRGEVYIQVERTDQEGNTIDPGDGGKNYYAVDGTLLPGKWRFVNIIMKPRPSKSAKLSEKVSFTELIIKVVRVDADNQINKDFHSQDHWKVTGVIFRCAETKSNEVSLKANIIPYRGVTKQFGATAGGEQ